MKKFIPILAIVIGIFLAITMTFIIKNRKYEIKINSYDDSLVLNLGKYKCTNFRDSKEDTATTYILFKVKDENDFYNSMIKKSNYFIPELAYEKDDKISGYLLKENSYFHYKIYDNSVKINSVAIQIQAGEPDYYAIADYVMYYDHKLENDVFKAWSNRNCSFADLLIFYSKLGNEYYKIEDNIIYLKGIYRGGEISDKFVVKIYESDSTIKAESLIL